MHILLAVGIHIQGKYWLIARDMKHTYGYKGEDWLQNCHSCTITGKPLDVATQLTIMFDLIAIAGLGSYCLLLHHRGFAISESSCTTYALGNYHYFIRKRPSKVLTLYVW